MNETIAAIDEELKLITKAKQFLSSPQCDKKNCLWSEPRVVGGCRRFSSRWCMARNYKLFEKGEVRKDNWVTLIDIMKLYDSPETFKGIPC